MSAELATPLREDVAAAASLLAHPTAPFVAMSAFGFGLATHAFGIWAGTAIGVAQVSQHLLAPLGAPRQGKPAGEAVPKRSRPALTIVPKAEPVETGPVESAPAAAAISARLRATPESSVKSDPPAARATADAGPAKPAKVKPARQATLPAAEPVATVEPVKGPRKPRGTERPDVPDDLKAISGIGPKLEKVLNDLGIWTYAQIAAWQQDEVAWVDDFLSFKGRIDRDGWIAQAAALAAGAAALR